MVCAKHSVVQTMKRHLLYTFLLSFFCLFLGNFVSSGQVKPEIMDLPTILNSNTSDSAKVPLLRKVISYYDNKGSDSAVYYANQGLKLFTERNYKDGQAWMIFSLANYEDDHGGTQSAMDKVQYAISIFSAQGDKKGLAQAYNLAGGLADKNGNFDKAIDFLLHELQVSVEMNDTDGVLRSWTNIGSVYDDNHDSAKTKEYYYKADSLARHLPVSESVISIYNNLAVYYFGKNDTLKTFQYLRKVFALSDNPAYALYHVTAMMNIGELYYTVGNVTAGRNNLDEALALTHQYNLPDQETTIWMNIAEFSKTKPVDSLIAYMNKAYALVKITGNKIKERRIYDAFATLYEKKQDYKQANEYLKLERVLTDSLYNVTKAKALANVASIYDLKLSTQRVHTLEQLINRNRLQRNIIIGIALLIVALSGILFYYFRRSKHLNHNLEHKQKQLEDLNNMKDKLFSVIGHDMRGPIANIPIVIDIIESEMDVPAEYREMLTLLKEHTIITVETLDKLMLLGKQYIRGENFIPEKFDTKPHIRENMELISFASGKKNITIEDHTPDDIAVYADAAHFDFIIRNLLSNAIKFSFDNSKIEINADKSRMPGYIVFSVKDHGTGMSETTLSHIFTASVTSTYGTGSEKGNGIGLMLCKDFIDQNGGKIWVESTKALGSTFYFSLKSA